MNDSVLDQARSRADRLRLATFRLHAGKDGTGFFFTPELALTAYHCLSAAGRRRVFSAYYGDRSIRLSWERDLSSEADDLAVLRLRSTDVQVQPVSVGFLDLSELERRRLWAGRDVVIFGYPIRDMSDGDSQQTEWEIDGTIALNQAVVGSFEKDRRIERLRIVGSGIPNTDDKDGPQRLSRLRGISGAPILDRDLGYVIGVQGSHDSLYVEVLGTEIGRLIEAHPELREWATELSPLLQPLPQRTHNLPAPTDSFVGRDTERSAVAQVLKGARLVTLTGPGGIGKTRLALEVARETAEIYPHGAWYVRLEAVTQPDLVPQQVARDLDLRSEAGAEYVDLLINYLRQRNLFLVLDNCEHLVDATANLAARLLAECPRLRILATSREALRVPGEFVWPLPPLSLPRHDHPADPESLGEAESVRLFIDRARRRQPGFALDARSGTAVASICRHLEGIPLAIELASAWVGVRSVEEIAQHSEDRFALPPRGDRATPLRHQTLRAAVDWSYDLLRPPERVLLDRLSVFSGSWTLDAAQSICAGGGIEVGAVLPLLSSLADKSLIIPEQQEGVTRYRQLETLREYGRQHLEQSTATVATAVAERDWPRRETNPIVEGAIGDAQLLARAAYPDRKTRSLASARPPATAWLVIEEGEYQGERMDIKANGQTRIGAQADAEINDYIIDDDAVSSIHFSIQHRDDEYVLMDLSSLNGTWLNGTKVTAPVRIRHGDRIRVGGTNLLFVTVRSVKERGPTLPDVVSDTANRLDLDRAAFRSPAIDMAWLAAHRPEIYEQVIAGNHLIIEEMISKGLLIPSVQQARPSVAFPAETLALPRRGRWARFRARVSRLWPWSRREARAPYFAWPLPYHGTPSPTDRPMPPASHAPRTGIGDTGLVRAATYVGQPRSVSELSFRQRQHADHYLAFVERGAAHLWQGEQDAWLDRFESEHHNIRAALTWYLDHDPDAASRVAALTWRFWQLRGYLAEGRRWLDRVLEQGGGSPPTRALSVLGAAFLARNQWDMSAAASFSEEGLALYEQLGDLWGASMALGTLGLLARSRGDYEQAHDLLTEALRRAQESGDQLAIGTTLWHLGAVARSRGDIDEARRLLEDAAATLHPVGDRYGLSLARRFLGLVALDTDQTDAAQHHLQESLAFAREIADPVGIGGSLYGLGLVALSLGEAQRAEALLRASRTHLERCGDRIELAWTLTGQAALDLARAEHEHAQTSLAQSLDLFVGARDRRGAAYALFFLGVLMVQQRNFDDGAAFLGAATRVHPLAGTLTAINHREMYDACVAEVGASLGPNRFALAWGKWESLDLAELADLARGPLDALLSSHGPTGSDRGNQDQPPV
jgi:predicted ATPase/pSer/pThr/pTyr-binding forkhead associated (FHA) protein